MCPLDFMGKYVQTFDWYELDSDGKVNERNITV